MANIRVVSTAGASCADAAEELARRAQPQTVASRLTLRDFQDVIWDMAGAAHALGDCIEDRWAQALPPGVRSVCCQAGARVRFAAGQLDDVSNQLARDLNELRGRDPENLDVEVTRDRRLLCRAADKFRKECEHLRGERGELDARAELLWSICADLGTAVNYMALHVDAATERALGRASSALTPMLAAHRELEHARRRADVLRAVSES